MLSSIFTPRILVTLSALALAACDPAAGDTGNGTDSTGGADDGGDTMIPMMTGVTTINPTTAGSDGTPDDTGADAPDDTSADDDTTAGDGPSDTTAAGDTSTGGEETTAGEETGNGTTAGEETGNGTTAGEETGTTASTEASTGSTGGSGGTGVDDLNAGDLLVTEVMYDAAFCNDADCEWVEIFNASGEAVNLQGLVVEDISGGTGTITDSVVMMPDTYAVLGRSDAAQFGYNNVNPVAFYGNNPALNNSGDDVVIIRNTEGVALDQSEVWTGQGSSDDGISFKRHPSDSTWCYSTASFEGSDLGSPGAENEEECNVPLPGGICLDVNVPKDSCSDLDPDNCTCVGCVDDNMCSVEDDCVCADCADDAFCGDVLNCVDDGFCSPFNEGCQCEDCAEHPECT